jgi:hypothetical protein
MKRRQLNKEQLVNALDYYMLPKDITKYFAMKMPKHLVKKLLGSKYVTFVTGFNPYDEDKAYETLAITYGESLDVDGVLILV